MDTDTQAPSQSTSNYLPALNIIATEIIAASEDIFSLYQQNQLPIKPETIIYVYARWLGYVIHQKIIGDKDHLSQLIVDTIEENIQQGKQFFHLVKKCMEQDNSQLDDFVKTHGVIVVSILKLTQFTSHLIQQSIHDKNHAVSQKEFDKKEAVMHDIIETIFENIYQKSVQEINELDINNPLIFLLEHFSIMLGWLIGFFTQLVNKSEDIFTQKSFLEIKRPKT